MLLYFITRLAVRRHLAERGAVYACQCDSRRASGTGHPVERTAQRSGTTSEHRSYQRLYYFFLHYQVNDYRSCPRFRSSVVLAKNASWCLMVVTARTAHPCRTLSCVFSKPGSGRWNHNKLTIAEHQPTTKKKKDVATAPFYICCSISKF